MGQMKYIRLRDEGFVIFEQHIQHSDMLEMLAKTRADVRSAGFVSGFFEEGYEPKCNGESVSLGISSRADDSDALNRRMNGYV